MSETTVHEHPPPRPLAAQTRMATARVIARRIRVALAGQDSNVSRLGRELGWTRNYLPKRMLGHAAWRVEDLWSIAGHLGLDIGELIAEADDDG